MNDALKSLQALSTWPRRRWLIALVAAVTAFLLVAVPTDLVRTPWFSREIPPTWWSWPALAAASVMTGLLLATYVAATPDVPPERSVSRRAGVGGLLNFFAVGCPVCNKLVLLALGSSGAVQWFEPIQPALSVAGLFLLGWALRMRLLADASCPTGPRPPSAIGDTGRRTASHPAKT